MAGIVPCLPRVLVIVYGMKNQDAHRGSANTGMSSVMLLLAAFAAGAGVMVYELLAVRILQRDFGGTMDVWAAEIAVCLAALALGYTFGGYAADRWPTPLGLYAALAFGGAGGFFVEPLALATADLLFQIDYGIVWHPLVAAGVSTFIPVFALGTVMPQTVRLYARRLDRVGHAAGRVAAAGTVGSVAGVLLTAMYLLRIWGVIRLLQVVSLTLLVYGVLGIVVHLARGKQAQIRKTGAPAPAIVLVTVLLFPLATEAQVRYETYSAYHHIIVADQGDTRVLYFDQNPQSLMSISNPDSGGFEYTDYFHMPILFDPTVSHVLFIGLGGGTGPKNFYKHYPDMKIDVLEIDPTVVEVARSYFHLPQDPRLNVTVGDGRALLRRMPGNYGAVLIDAYGSGPSGAYLPYHLATQEFFTQVWEKLANGGSVVYNAVGAHGGMNSDVIRDLLVTLESVFQAVYVFGAGSSINTVFVAQKIDASRLTENRTRDGKGWPEGPWLAHPLNARALQELVANMPRDGFHTAAPLMTQRVKQFSRAHTARRTGRILTDDFAPVDIAPTRR